MMEDDTGGKKTKQQNQKVMITKENKQKHPTQHTPAPKKSKKKKLKSGATQQLSPNPYRRDVYMCITGEKKPNATEKKPTCHATVRTTGSRARDEGMNFCVTW